MTKNKEVTNKELLKAIGGIGRRLDGHDKQFININKRLDGIDGRLDGIDEKLEIIDVRLEAHDEKLVGHDTKIDQILEIVTEIREDNLVFANRIDHHDKLIAKNSLRIEEFGHTALT